MAGLRLTYRLAGMLAVCLALVGSPLDAAQRMGVLTAVAIASGVAVTAAVPWSDRWVARSVIPAVLVVALVPLEAPGSIAGLVALVVLGAASCRGAGLARVVPASGLPLITLSLRTGEMIEPWLVVGWVVAVAVTLLARAAAWPIGPQRPIASSTSDRPLSGHRQALAAGAVLLVVAPVALQLAFVVTARMPPVAATASQGDPAGPRIEAHPGLDGGLDVGTPVELSNEVVLRVRAEEPRYWRGTTYEEWDGRRWSSRLASIPLTATGGGALPAQDEATRSVPADLDLPEPVALTQRFTTERAGLDVLLGAWRIESLDVPIQRARLAGDGSIRLDEPLGAGATWTVVSEEVPATKDDLRRADPLRIDDGGVDLGVYATEDNVSEAVAELARELTADQATTYDKVVAIESWMDANLTYSRDIPVLGANRDPVHHLLFESKRGYCEQIGTALVVMLRSLGIPARLAVGYVPSDFDPSTGSWVSRASDAHTWAEVYFPGVGWRGFDPTAGVPTAVDERPAEQLETGTSMTTRAVLMLGMIVGLWLVLTPTLRRRFPTLSLPGPWARLRPGRSLVGNRETSPVLALHDRLDRCGSKLPEVWAPTMTVRDRAQSMIGKGVEPEVVMTAIRALERVTFGTGSGRESHDDAVASAEAAMDALEAAIVSRANESKGRRTGPRSNGHPRDRAPTPSPSRNPVP